MERHKYCLYLLSILSRFFLLLALGASACSGLPFQSAAPSPEAQITPTASRPLAPLFIDRSSRPPLAAHFPSCQPDAAAFAPPAAAADDLAAVTPAPGDPLALRSLADARNLWLGAAVGGGEWKDPQVAVLLQREFNMLASGNYLKWYYVHPEPDVYNFEDADRLLAFARQNGLAFYGHVLVWSLLLPDWLTQGGYSRDETIDILCRHIKTVVSRYRGQIYAWHVVNEAFADDGTLADNFWLRAIGPEYIGMAFQWAYEADPNTYLIYNDFAGEGLNKKSQAIYSLAQGLLQAGVPLDGVGLQMHVWLGGQPPVDELAANMQRLADLGLRVHITEMDVRTQYSPLSEAEKLRSQAEIYHQVMAACLAASTCDVFMTWGPVDRYSWIKEYFGPDMPLLFDENYQPKPAYDAVREALLGP